jgi:hypothetical protein
MNLAVNGARDTVAEGLGSFFGWLFGRLGWLFGDLAHTAWGLGVLVVALLAWRLSLAFGPKKVCWHCGGKGHSAGWFGGRKSCKYCGGNGIRPRIGSR